MAKMSKADHMTQIWQDVIRLYFRLQAMGRDVGAVSTQNGGTWGVLNTLVTHGPTTVPEIARMRPVSRQHIQTLANELVEDGLAEFTHNPHHRRSKFLAITDKGRAVHGEQSSAMRDIAKSLVGEIPKSELEATERVLSALVEKMTEAPQEENTGEAPGPTRVSKRHTGMHASFKRRHPKEA